MLRGVPGAVPGANAKGTSKFDDAWDSVGLWAFWKGAFSGSLGGGRSDSESRSFTVSLGVVFLRPQKQNKAAIKAARTMTTPTTIPAIAPAGRPEEPPDVDEGVDEEDESEDVCVATGTEKVFVGDTAEEAEEELSSVEDAVGSIFRNFHREGWDTSSKENWSVTKSRRGNIERLSIPNNIPNIPVRLCRRARRIGKPCLLISPA